MVQIKDIFYFSSTVSRLGNCTYQIWFAEPDPLCLAGAAALLRMTKFVNNDEQ